MSLARLHQVLAEGGWVSHARIRRWAGLMLIGQIVIGLTLAAGAHGMIVTLHGAGTTDFVSFYAAGTVAGGADPAAVYDQAVHYAAERAATDPRIDYVHFFYPPVFLLLCRALAALPYLTAFYVFGLATLGFYLQVVHRIVATAEKPVPAGSFALAVLGFSPVLWNFGFGQNAALTAGLLGLGTLLLIRGRSFAAGLVLGLLIYKPHTALLLPVALIAGRQPRAVLGAALSVGLGIAASIAAFGIAPWPAFAHALAQSSRDFAAGGITPFSNMVNIAGALRDHGVAPAVATALQSAGALAAACVVAWAWARGAPTASRAAVLAASAIIAMPVVLFYDLLVPSIAAAWLIAQGLRGGFLSYEKSVLAAVWLAASLAYPLSRAGHVPIGLICCGAVLVLALRRHGRDSVLFNPFARRLHRACRVDPGGLGWS